MDMTLTSPLRFVPYLRPMVWGGRGLAEHLHKALPSGEPYGESWEVSDHPLHRSAVADGPFQGTTLRTLMETRKAELLGPVPYDVFPWLIKFLDCRDWLSVQVHPDTDVVKHLRPGEGSKTEAWYVLHAEPGSRVYAGLKPGVGPTDMRAAVAAGTTHELLHAFEPRAGDCVFLPAGTVHAVGGGVLIAEIQETSDVTFRLFDWNRVGADGKGRALHIEESFASIHWDKGPVAPLHPDSDAAHIRCPFFHLSYRKVTSPIKLGGEKMQAMIIVAGHGTWDDGRAVEIGQTWVLPASMASQRLRPETPMKILDAVLPFDRAS
jgi:mannose-6-phosphate isomerase